MQANRRAAAFQVIGLDLCRINEAMNGTDGARTAPAERLRNADFEPYLRMLMDLRAPLMNASAQAPGTRQSGPPEMAAVGRFCDHPSIERAYEIVSHLVHARERGVPAHHTSLRYSASRHDIARRIEEQFFVWRESPEGRIAASKSLNCSETRAFKSALAETYRAATLQRVEPQPFDLLGSIVRLACEDPDLSPAIDWMVDDTASSCGRVHELTLFLADKLKKPMDMFLGFHLTNPRTRGFEAWAKPRGITADGQHLECVRYAASAFMLRTGSLAGWALGTPQISGLPNRPRAATTENVGSLSSFGLEVFGPFEEDLESVVRNAAVGSYTTASREARRAHELARDRIVGGFTDGVGRGALASGALFRFFNARLECGLVDECKLAMVTACPESRSAPEAPVRVRLADGELFCPACGASGGLDSHAVTHRKRMLLPVVEPPPQFPEIGATRQFAKRPVLYAWKDGNPTIYKTHPPASRITRAPKPTGLFFQVGGDEPYVADEGETCPVVECCLFGDESARTVERAETVAELLEDRRYEDIVGDIRRAYEAESGDLFGKACAKLLHAATQMREPICERISSQRDLELRVRDHLRKMELAEIHQPNERDRQSQMKDFLKERRR